ncbi:hypothetical protein [Methyloversatilis discipulorum]|uniref:hypothetical protein n=1 Tax=Methyloversatilis discipulorum TaxID=1119528 RepID=UPI0012FB72C4|nr:hypothetical protein [Methyloversatilis discipulorum]
MMKHYRFAVAACRFAKTARPSGADSLDARSGWLEAARHRVRVGVRFLVAAAATHGFFAHRSLKKMSALRAHRVPAFVISIGTAISTAGCVTTGSHANRVEVSQVTPELIKRQIVLTDSSLDVTATLSTAGIVMNRSGHLVALVDKETGGVAYSYIAQLVYSDEGWRYYSSANSSVNNSPRQTPVQVLSRNVAGCSRAVRTYNCTYDERVAVPIDSEAVQWIASLYREGSDVRWVLRFNGDRSPITHEVLPQEAVALRAAVGEYLAQRSTGSGAIQPR